MKKPLFRRVFTIIVGLFAVICMCHTASSQNINLLPAGSVWNYLDDGSDQGTAWIDNSFDHSTWNSGPGQLGYGDGDETTIIDFGPDPDNKYIATYFRKQITIADLNAFEYIKMTLTRDDGAVIYINGNEVLRSNMPVGTITYQTFSTANNEAVETHFIPKTAFVAGLNTIAVSIHQTNLTSSDLSFDMALEGVKESFVISSGALWKYLDNGSDQGTAWVNNSFDASAWVSGPAPLGYVMTGVATTVSFGASSSNKHRTTYFRKNVEVTSLDSFDSLQVTLRIDDGAIVYLNGAEILRRNMPAGAVTSTTFANVTVGSAPSVFTVMLEKTLLNIGTNVFAVEVHQSTANSSDLFFDLAVEPYKKDSVIVSAGGNWKFNDQEGTPDPTWTNSSFDDASWTSGNAVFGYGNGDETTIISYGNEVQNKHITAYFRKKITMNDLSGYQNLSILLMRDDAAIIYINGTEVHRSNIPSGTLTHQTVALTPVEGSDETKWNTINLPVSVLTSGENTIAVEIHKFNSTETDLRFDLQMKLQSKSQTATPLSLNVNCNPNTSSTIGCFTSVKPQAQTQGFIIPQTHTFQLIVQQGNNGLYSNSTRAMPGNHDFTGYVPTNGSSEKGVVSVNHENGPGDVSLLSLHLNRTSMTWVLDSARLVDFTTLVRTERNCSGGVTPWGTVITSEENTTTGDANADGYHDRGWQVEIDPISGKVVDQDGDGNPDKIWAMGRMNHENIAISADSAVAYQAEDGGTSCVYKYVLDQKGKMVSGTLYVLQRSTVDPTTGTWIQVPNTTQSERNSTNTLAGSLGGTNWNGPEDVEFGPDGKMYFTSKGTGTIWRFKDNGTTVTEVEAWVTNTNYSIFHSEGTTNESFGTGIDNLTFDGEGNLWALQDGGRGHLWVIRPDHTPAVPHVELFAVTPAGSESTGLTFTPDYKYGFVSIQHPSGTNATILKDAAGNDVRFNTASTIVFARKENLGTFAVMPAFELGSDSIASCEDPVELTANTSADIVNVWNDNSAGNTLTVTETGWYKVTAYSNNGRTYTDSVYVAINENPVLELGADVEQCGGEYLLSAGNENYEYLWNDNSTNHELEVTVSGEFTVTKTDPETGCSSNDEIEVEIYDIPEVDLGLDQLICSTCSTLLDAGSGFVNYLWNTSATTSTLLVSNAGTYSVTVTDANGCEASSSIVITKETATSIDEALAVQNGFVVLQDVHSNDITIVANLTAASFVNLTLTDVNGSIVKVITRADYSAGTHRWELNTRQYQLAPGMYFAFIEAGNMKETRKIIVY